jgi:cyclopropane-fatty-acyl-phospholipid synthase
MSLRTLAIALAERITVPDPVLRFGVDLRVQQLARLLSEADPHETEVIAALMGAQPIVHPGATGSAWAHDLPPEFFGLILGPRRKHSCCLYDQATTLAQAEERALEVIAAGAGLADGQRILDLGCGWGPLSLWLAERFPRAEIVAVSDLPAHQAFVAAEAARRGLGGVRAVAANVADFTPDGQFDRIVAIQLFESIANWSALLARLRPWLRRGGSLFLETMAHRRRPYRFVLDGDRDWIARYFFTGGTMPSHGLIRAVDAPFSVAEEWRHSGLHFHRTATDWLARFDANRARIAPMLAATYGPAAALWERRWRLGLIATGVVFGARGGADWGISQYRLEPR